MTQAEQTSQIQSFRLKTATMGTLVLLAEETGLSKSAIVEHLVGELAKFGPERITWPKK